MGLENELLQIERTLWTNDADVYGSVFLPEAVIIFPEVGRIDLDFALDAIREENEDGRRWAEVDLAEPRAVAMTPDSVLLHYSATARWNYAEMAERAFCATLYVRREGAWRAAFHQQSPATS